MMVEAGAILGEVERFLKRTATPAARFGRECMGDPRFISDLRAGRELRPKTVQKVRDFMAAQVEKRPYGVMCVEPSVCVRKGYCHRDPTCAD